MKQAKFVEAQRLTSCFMVKHQICHWYVLWKYTILIVILWKTYVYLWQTFLSQVNCSEVVCQNIKDITLCYNWVWLWTYAYRSVQNVFKHWIWRHWDEICMIYNMFCGHGELWKFATPLQWHPPVKIYSSVKESSSTLSSEHIGYRKNEQYQSNKSKMWLLVASGRGNGEDKILKCKSVNLKYDPMYEVCYRLDVKCGRYI